MSKFSTTIGFGVNTEVQPGVYEDLITERNYRGDILRNNQRFAVQEIKLGDVQITNTFSVVGDSYAFSHITEIKYLKWQGNCWLVNTVDMEYPRINMTIGGLYNGPQGESSEYSRED